MIVHEMNGQLIETVCKLLDIDEEGKREWIINAIVVRLSRTSEDQSFTLNNSATLRYGEPFYSPEDCGPDKSVRWLDGRVPMSESIAGHVVKQGELVWMNNLFEEPYWARKYRDYLFVGVDTDSEDSPRPLPTAEYVFPIKSTFNMVTATLGVLNFEHYPGENGSNPFLHAPTETSAKLSGVLSSHSSFLLLALELEVQELGELGSRLQVGETRNHIGTEAAKRVSDVRRLSKSVLRCHKQVMRWAIDKYQKEFPPKGVDPMVARSVHRDITKPRSSSHKFPGPSRGPAVGTRQYKKTRLRVKGRLKTDA